MGRIPSEQLDYDGESGLWLYSGHPFTGVSFVLGSPGGYVESEKGYLDGALHGRCREWWRPEVLQMDAIFEYGMPNGESRSWREDGTLASVDVYEFGIRLWGVGFDANDTVNSTFRLGPADENFSLLEAFRDSHGRSGHPHVRPAIPTNVPRPEPERTP